MLQNMTEVQPGQGTAHSTFWRHSQQELAQWSVKRTAEWQSSVSRISPGLMSRVAITPRPDKRTVCQNFGRADWENEFLMNIVASCFWHPLH